MKGYAARLLRDSVVPSKMSGDCPTLRLYGFGRTRKCDLPRPTIYVLLRGALLAAGVAACVFAAAARADCNPAHAASTLFSSLPSAKQNNAATTSAVPAPVVVQPGAPGQPTKTLPSSTKGILPPPSPADVAFMQGMIMHHAQAVVMTAWIPSHTENKDLRLLGARISRSQTDEINFMKRWLAARGEPLSLPMAGMPDASGQPGMNRSGKSDADGSGHAADSMAMPLMPGMLTPEQMDALNKAKGAEFDRLFLVGMIQHHNGALIMVKDLFDTAGAGQDADIFNFATDADNTQRAEIRIMQSMLDKNSLEEKR
jgi:uncharacterized protein (DUF305 family)